MAAPNKITLGFEGKLYYCLAGVGGTPVWTELTTVQNETVTSQFDKSEVSPRGMNGFKAMVNALRESGCDFEIPNNPSDTDLAALISAHATSATVGFALSDIDMLTTGAEVFKADFQVGMWKQKKDTNGHVQNSFSIHLTWPFGAAPSQTVTT